MRGVAIVRSLKSEVDEQRAQLDAQASLLRSKDTELEASKLRLAEAREEVKQRITECDAARGLVSQIEGREDIREASAARHTAENANLRRKCLELEGNVVRLQDALVTAHGNEKRAVTRLGALEDRCVVLLWLCGRIVVCV